MCQPTVDVTEHRSVEFNSRFNPHHQSGLRRIFLATDNAVAGRYYAGILRASYSHWIWTYKWICFLFIINTRCRAEHRYML